MHKHFEISYLPLAISLLALEQAELPSFLGSTLRGAIGQSLPKWIRRPVLFYIGMVNRWILIETRWL